MNKQEILVMVGMLIKATKNNRLNWLETEPESYSYITTVNGCDIKVFSSYDYDIGLSNNNISLFNRDGQLFSTYSYSKSVDDQGFDVLEELLDTIRDVQYKISESEKLIMDGLADLNKGL